MAGLVEATLAPAQPCQTHQSLLLQHRPGGRQLLGRGVEFLLGFTPLTLSDEHAGVLGPADRQQRIELYGFRERLHAAAPLRSAIKIPYPLAGIEHVTARVTNGEGIVQLTGERCRHGPVEPVHAIGDLAFSHQSRPFKRVCRHLDIVVAKDLAYTHGLPSARARRYRITLLG
jgi:hypothetical protein